MRSGFEADQIVDKGDLGPPGQLDQLPVPLRQAFPKVNSIKTMLLDHTAGFQFDFAER